MKDLTPLAEQHKNQLESNAPFIFMFEIEVPGGTERIRACQFDKIVNFGSGSNGPLKYYPVPMSVGSLRQTSEGDLPTIDVTVQLSGPIDFLSMDSAEGFTDQPMRVLLVSSLDFFGPPIIDEQAVIVEANMSYESISFKIAGANIFNSKFPHLLYTRNACPFWFGDGLCGYDTKAIGARFQQCGVDFATGETVFRPFSYDACEAAGDDEVSLGLTRRHPERWGGERGIPRG